MKGWPMWNLGLECSEQRKQTVVTLGQECVWQLYVTVSMDTSEAGTA